MEKLTSVIKWVQEAATNVGRFLIGFTLLFIGLCLMPLVILVALIHFACTVGPKKQNAGELLTTGGIFSKYVAIGLDILGNIIAGGFFNWLLLKTESPFPFGVPGEKISSVLEWNHRLNNLSEWGENLRRDLDIIERNHCKKSVEADIEYAQSVLERYLQIEQPEVFKTLN